MLTNEIKVEDVLECFSSKKEMFDVSNYYDQISHWTKKEVIKSVAIEKIIELKAERYSFLIDDNSKLNKSRVNFKKY